MAKKTMTRINAPKRTRTMRPLRVGQNPAEGKGRRRGGPANAGGTRDDNGVVVRPVRALPDTAMSHKKPLSKPVMLGKKRPEQQIGTASTYRKPPASGGRVNRSDGGLRNTRRQGEDRLYTGTSGAPKRKEGPGPTLRQRALRGYEKKVAPKRVFIVKPVSPKKKTIRT